MQKSRFLLLSALMVGLFMLPEITQAVDCQTVEIGKPTPNLRECVFGQNEDGTGAFNPLARLFINLTVFAHTSIGATFSLMYIVGFSLTFTAYFMMNKGMRKKDGGDPEGTKYVWAGGAFLCLGVLILNTTGYIQLTADTVGMGNVVNARLNLRNISVMQIGTAGVSKPSDDRPVSRNGFADTTRAFGVETSWGK